MCTGKTHATSGLASGLAVGEFVLHLPPGALAAFACLVAGWATWPDLDQRGSCAARSLGFFSESVAWIIGKASGGHRHLTHTFLGIAIFTGLATAACAFRSSFTGRACLAVFLLLGIAAGIGALRIRLPRIGHFRPPRHAADVLGALAAAGMAWYGWGLALVPYAVALGVATHIIGDMMTDSGVMVMWPFSRIHVHLLPEPFAWTTGSKPETGIVDPVLALSAAALGIWALDPALDLMAWHAVTHYL